MMRRFILSHHRSPGDLVCLTALMRDIHLNYPGQFETDFYSTVTPIWNNSPYITKLWDHKPIPKGQALRPTHRDTRVIKCGYSQGLKDQNRETIHFCAYFHRDFEKQTGIKVIPRQPHGDIHLNAYEKQTPPVNGKYWLILSGGKSDFPIKVWNKHHWQAVSDRIGELGLGVVQTGATSSGHWHPKITGDHVIDLVGWGTFREFVQQIYHAEGVVCGITAAMHLAAALHKPCVVIGGGREAPWWESYGNYDNFGPACPPHPVPHRYLHTIGLLDCCKHHGCWRNSVVGTLKSRPCLLPVRLPDAAPVAKCLDMVTPDHVLNAITSYYLDGSLEPLPGMLKER